MDLKIKAIKIWRAKMDTKYIFIKKFAWRHEHSRPILNKKYANKMQLVEKQICVPLSKIFFLNLFGGVLMSAVDQFRIKNMYTT